MSYVSISPWVFHYDGSSCNGCDIEVLAALTPLYDAERFGVVNTGNPKHADIFIVTGGVNAQNAPIIKQQAMTSRQRQRPLFLQCRGPRGKFWPVLMG